MGLRIAFVLIHTMLASAASAAAVVDLSKELEVDEVAVSSSPGAMSVNDYAASDAALRAVMVLEDGKVVANYARDDVGVNEVSPCSICKLSLNSTLGSVFTDEYIWDEAMPDADFRKAITIEEMVSMTSGLQAIVFDSEAFTFVNMDDWDHIEPGLKQTIAMPSIGERGEYSYLGTSDILGFVILEVSGLTPRQYLDQNVLPKLGIDSSDIVWVQNESSGMENVFGGLELTPTQMAKFGQLYLQGGKAGPLESSRVVSEEWVDRSWTVSTEEADPALTPQTLHMGITKEQLNEVMPPMGHGFLWYKRSFGEDAWCADGSGGQHICVAPSLGRVVVQQRDLVSDPNLEMIDILAIEATLGNQVAKIATDESLSFKGKEPDGGEVAELSDKSSAMTMMLGGSVAPKPS
ncbi:hypothetical protein THAOC_06222 [Thalassiosira oceanica]|uniref:Beta-lactamase-related domain-containing protein n=1 Tax=Thalassiosira oceanica TaxID=159749 RepID=K0TLY3_THAOC|nr:hypothetical protein THAOC_06222 [Thalassiosira oceanica]|eukprot:EJK72257.1 hypothetical protein THAOC_06222 [Thalassiosira oceanica]